MANMPTNRGSKKQVICSSSPPLMSTELRSTIQDIIKEEFKEMIAKFNNTIVSAINQELEPIRIEIQGILESMSFMNKMFEEVRNEQVSIKETAKKLEIENKELNSTVESLTERLNNIEQQSRSNNLEVQCVPENKNENVYNIITQVARTVNCEINEKDILYCTRIAKNNPSNHRPRSIIVQLASPRVRDQLLAATIKYNQANPKERLNCSLLGYSGPKSPIYVTEHLSPTNRALHAAARIKAKEKNYKYVWVRNGRIFIRKTDGANSIQIKCKDSLTKIV